MFDGLRNHEAPPLRPTAEIDRARLARMASIIKDDLFAAVLDQ